MKFIYLGGKVCSFIPISTFIRKNFGLFLKIFKWDNSFLLHNLWVYIDVLLCFWWFSGFFFKIWFYITYKVYTQVIGYKKTDTSYFIKVPLHDYSIWNHLPMYCLIVHKFIVFFLFAASCIWRCKRVGTRKVIHLEIDIYLAYWYFLF